MRILQQKSAFPNLCLFILSFLLWACADLVESDSRKKTPATGTPSVPSPDTKNPIVKRVLVKANRANFLVLTNLSAANSGQISIQVGPKQVGQEEAQHVQEALPVSNLILRQEAGPIMEHARLPDPPTLGQVAPSSASLFMAQVVAPDYEVDDKETFNVEIRAKYFGDKSFVLKKKVEEKYSGDTYSIHYWVDPAQYVAANKSKADNIIGLADVEALAARFSNPSANSDILRASIDIFGPPWGDHKILQSANFRKHSQDPSPDL